MNFLEKAIATVSPGWAAKRSHSRYVLNAYEAALPSRTHKAIGKIRRQILPFYKVR